MKLYLASEERGAYVRLDREVPEHVVKLRDQRAAVAMLSVALPWQVSFSYPFRRQSHINILEAEALVSLTRRLAKAGLRHRRIVVLLDSSVLVGAASSAHRLNQVLRRLAS